MPNDTIAVVVQYVGQNDFHDQPNANVPVKQVKKQAMHAFGLEASAADMYVLQFNGADVDEKAKLSDFGVTSITFVLSLKGEVPKG